MTGKDPGGHLNFGSCGMLVTSPFPLEMIK